MMYIKKLLILSNIFFLCLLKGQSTEIKEEIEIINIDYLKKEVYKSIILSEEFKSNKKCYIVGINSISLKMDYSVGGTLGFYYKNLQITKDSTSLKEIRKELPKQYWVFEDPYKFLGVEYNMGYVNMLKKSDSLYIPQKIDFESDVCKSSMDIIKIYEPLDKWMNFYDKHYTMDYRGLEVVVPVKYEVLSKGALFLEKEKYFLFKIKLEYNDKGRLEILKEVIGGQ